MEGIGPPLVTPFDRDGDVDHDRLRDLVAWVEDRDVDFLVPCGSTSEGELLTDEERARVVETVADEASVPVLAGTGHPGLRATLEATAAAAAAGADGALVVTPHYYNHDQETLAAYYRELADESPLPIYLYSVPVFADARIDPETARALAEHPNVAGMKDSSGDLAEFVRTVERVGEDFAMLVGTGSLLAQALDAGASGGIAALANLYPGRLAAVVDAHPDDPALARERNRRLVEVDTAITSEFGIPGLKWAMRERGAPAGYPRSPHTEPGQTAKDRLATLLGELA
ncbi:MAG: dihydrodipicolinate synthase family protein [Haloferacaceae archaeon]